jgi:hypothetical protein
MLTNSNCHGRALGRRVLRVAPRLVVHRLCLAGSEGNGDANASNGDGFQVLMQRIEALRMKNVSTYLTHGYQPGVLEQRVNDALETRPSCDFAAFDPPATSFDRNPTQGSSNNTNNNHKDQRDLFNDIDLWHEKSWASLKNLSE